MITRHHTSTWWVVCDLSHIYSLRISWRGVQLSHALVFLMPKPATNYCFKSHLRCDRAPGSVTSLKLEIWYLNFCSILNPWTFPFSFHVFLFIPSWYLTVTYFSWFKAYFWNFQGDSGHHWFLFKWFI